MKENKNVFIIKTNLEDYLDSLKNACKSYNIFCTTMEDLYDVVKKITYYTNRENNLIILNEEIYNENNLEIIHNIFSSKLYIQFPHLLFISNKSNKKLNHDEYTFNQNFYLFVSDEEKKIKKLIINDFSIKLIFDRIKDFKVLESYIVDSFHTIVDSTIAARQKHKIEKMYDNLKVSSKIDALTNVYTRKALFEALRSEIKRVSRANWRLKEAEFDKTSSKNSIKKILDHYGIFSCLMIDVDDFKKINDTHGHLLGDIVLKELGNLLITKGIFRENDIIGRYGGEEFMVILPDTNSYNAKFPAERIRENIKQIKFNNESGENFKITISIGISMYYNNDTSHTAVIDRADKALYYAKNNGKDKTIIYEEIFN